ncbi:MAG TPA: lasso peptide biosynthesis B2 protein [Longimicrobium sp.]|nr:lasso peptide biosynthesis B2 protein [Longimicrobium sp.]
MSPISQLEAWLLRPEQATPPSSDLLHRAGLGPYAYTALPPGHPERAALRGDYLAFLSRHHRIRAELAPLLRAWNDAGIEPLLFKGFHLAEFVYPVAGARAHQDVDVLVRPEQAGDALRVARGLGWIVEGDTAEVGMPWLHCAASLYSRSGDTYLDVHRWALHRDWPGQRVQERITRAVWDASRAREWEGARVREMAPVDALLVGLVLQRCWGPDGWAVKPHDPLDMRMLERDVPRDALLARARELGASGTLRRFLARCDPAAGRLSLAPPARAERRRLDLLSFAERGAMGRAGRLLGALRRAPSLAPSLLRMLRRVMRVRRAVRVQPDLRRLLGSLTPPTAPEPTDARAAWRRFELVRGACHAVRLLRTNPRGDCLVRSLAVYAALREQGWPVRFVSGVRRGATDIEGHAWVEMDGRVLWELNEPDNRRFYQVNFTYPPEAPAEASAPEPAAARG